MVGMQMKMRSARAPIWVGHTPRRGGKHHVHEVFHVAVLVLRIHERESGVVLVRHRRDGRHFASSRNAERCGAPDY